MEVSAALVKELREKTGASIIECKKALLDTDANLEEAINILKQQGLLVVEKKAARIVNEGMIEAYVHPGGRVGAMVEVNCETDFVARTPEFIELAHNLALQITAMAPQFIAKEEMPPDADLNPEIVCLLQQPFIKDNDKTIQDLITTVITKTGENIKIRRFARFELSG